MVITIHLALVVLLGTILGVVIVHERKSKLAKLKNATILEIWDGDERRRAIRVNTSVPISCSAVNTKGHAGTGGCTKNISIGGVQFISEALYHPEDKTQLELYLPNFGRISAQCEVIWTKEVEAGESDRRYFAIGMKFNRLSQKDRAALSNYLSSILSKSETSQDQSNG